MGNLKDDLPKITKKVLQGEDKVTAGLVNTLFQQVLINQNKLEPYPTIRKALDDEIDKAIRVDFIDINDFKGDK